MAIPTATFDQSKTIVPVRSIITLTPTVGGTPGTAVSLPLKKLGYSPSIEVTKREIPDAKGALRPDRIVVKSRSQILKAEIEEIADLPAAFGGTALGIDGGLARGTCEIFVIDADDAATKVALKSDKAFKAVWKLDGDTSFDTAEVSKVTLNIEALEDFALIPDATVGA